MNLYEYMEKLRKSNSPPSDEDWYFLEEDPSLRKTTIISGIGFICLCIVLLIGTLINEGVPSSNWIKYVAIYTSMILFIFFLAYLIYWIGLRWQVGITGVIQEGWGQRKEITWASVARIKRHPYSLRIHFYDAEGKLLMKITGNVPGNTLNDPWILPKIEAWSQLTVER